jgi:hypothetical protein
MNQSRTASLIESVFNVVIGYGVALAIQPACNFPDVWHSPAAVGQPGHRSLVHHHQPGAQLCDQALV